MGYLLLLFIIFAAVRGSLSEYVAIAKGEKND